MNRFFICAAIAFLLIPSSVHANLLVNPGFETGDFTGWSQWTSSNSTIYDWGHSGSYSASGWWETSAWQDVAITDSNTPLKVGGWIYDNFFGDEYIRGGVYATIEAQFKDSSDTVIGTWTTGELTTGDLVDDTWNEKTAIVTPSSYGAGITKVTLKWEVNHVGNGAGRGIFDDFIVEPTTIPEPASLLMLGSGILGIGMFGKSRKSGKKERGEVNG